MAYEPKNKAKFRSPLDSKHPMGDGGGSPNKAQVPGTTGSDDRESQPVGAELNGQFTSQAPDGNVNRQNGSDFSIMDRGRDDENPRTQPNFGKRTYAAGTPTLGDY